MEPIAVVRQSTAVIDVSKLTRDERKCARVGAFLGVAFFVLLATWAQPWNMFAKGPFSSNFYDVQARSMVHGHMDVPSDVAQVEGFAVDGKTQLYFGVGPAIARAPFTGWTSIFDGRLTILSMTIASGVLAMASARLLKRAQAAVVGAPSGSPWWFGAIAAASIVCTLVLFTASRAVVYHEAAIWGCAAAVAGLDLVIRWWREPTRRHFVGAVALAAFAISCRTTSGSAPAIALGLFGLVLAWRREWLKSAKVVAGALIALVAYVGFNWLRFHNLVSQPYEAQVWTLLHEDRREFVESVGGNVFQLKFVPTSVAKYFSPVAVGFQRLFPFVNFGSRIAPIGGVDFGEIHQSSSVVIGAPVFSFLALIGGWWAVVRDRSHEWIVIVIASAVAFVPTLMCGFLSYRYAIDILPSILVLACPGVWLVARQSKNWKPRTRNALLVVAAVVSFFGTWTQVGLALETRAFSMLPTESDARSFVSLQNSIDRRLFENAPSNVLQLFERDDLPVEGISEGTIVILDDCSGMYHYDGDNWQVVERKPGGGRRFVITGTIDSEAKPVLQGFGWTLTARRTSDGVIFVYDASYGRHDEFGPVSLPDGPLTFEAVADQAQIATISLTLGDKKVLSDDFLAASKAQPGPGWRSDPGQAPLCESFLSRLGK